MPKEIWELNSDEWDALMKKAAKKAIEETHAAGRPSTHGDDVGVYHLYPDGRKEYIKEYRATK